MIVLICVYVLFYVLNSLHWWGLVAFGTAYTEESMWYSIAMFGFTLVWIGCMLISGYKANQKLALFEFYQEKINDKESEIREFEAREAQKRE